MEINVRIIHKEQKEYIEIGCHRRDEKVEELIRFVKLHQGSVEAFSEEKRYQLPLSDIYYIEALENRTFLYLEQDYFESRKRLYEFEDLLSGRNFARISKSVIVNMMKIEAIRPAMNGRFLCQLKNGEKVIISRKYVQDMKERLQGH